MLQTKVIGIGAAGAKAAITAIKKGAITRDKCMLLNSTSKDIPEEFRDIYIQYKNAVGGCGKEREKAKELVLSSLQDSTIALENWLDASDDLIVIVSSTEGGTGSGSTPTLAKYINNVLGFNVHVYALLGFEDDIRGLKNSVNFFQELEETFSVQSTSNKRFLKATGGNRVKAEQMANEEFAKRLSILQGQMIVDSEQNIDQTDLYKLSTQSGYTNIEYIEIEDKIKNVDQFNDLLNQALDNSKSLETISVCKRMGVILNINKSTLDHIDNGFKVLKERLGTPFEFYTHIQDIGQKEYICIIASGAKLPIDELNDVYDKYRKETEAIDKNKDNFFSSISELKDAEEDEMFDSASSYKATKTISKKSKEDFFSSMGKSTKIFAGNNEVDMNKF